MSRDVVQSPECLAETTNDESVPRGQDAERAVGGVFSNARRVLAQAGRECVVGGGEEREGVWS